MSLPRLTTALRAYSSVTAKFDNADDDDDNELSQKQHRRSERQARDTLSWKQLVNLIKSGSSGKKDCSAELKCLQQAALAIVGGTEVDTEMAQSAAVFLFDMYRDSCDGPVPHSDISRLQSCFGTVSQKSVSVIRSAVQRVRSAISDHTYAEISAAFDGLQANKMREFGDQFKINFDAVQETSDEDLDWLETFNDDPCTIGRFSMQYVGTSKQSDAADKQKTRELPRDKPSDNPTAQKVGGRGWLYREMETHFGSSSLGSDLNVLVASVFEILCSSRTNEQLQNELFDLLGFDRFDLIQSLLLHRQDVIRSAFGVEPGAAQTAAIAAAAAAAKSEPSRPTFGCQVVIQTEDEKQLRKLVRREEKKVRRKDADQDTMESSKFNFNPDELRAQREAALYAAQNTPLFSGNRPATYQQEHYPFVFDSYAVAKQSSGFVGGAKLILPVGFERNSQKLYEEVNIPACERPPENFAYSPVAIDSMDELCKTAFRGTKKLNLIQSVVYETAYKSNENLLICAPTGAGKTNIAMLAILHTLQQNIVSGVIQIDKFKIVYVAPMKALAAEMVRNFGGRLAPLGVTVAELTGDMQLSKAEIMKTQMLVTTPEKWDVVTRKSTGDVALTQLVRLLIIDEVHLLHDDRGAVIESLVARTLRQVESSQTMIRIVGLSATLPNYIDVARFLRVNCKKGLFFFDGRFRPVPLAQTFIGIKATNRMQQMQDFNTVCYEKVVLQVQRGHQVMVFVHARNETVRTANVLCEMARNSGQITLFAAEKSARLGEAMKQIQHSRNKQLRELFPEGFAIHHAGMLRQDRNLVERYFADGLVRVIVCTATLAWGVNLPAHAVVIKGTQIYDAKKGSFVDLGVLDVMQIFGRAGRPQYDTFGHGTILTTHDKLSHYLSLLTQQNPIESQFINSLTDNLNAEISLGTVTNVEEGVKWLSYTYLYVRMRCNPLVYGVPYGEVETDPTLEQRRRDLIVNAARELDKARMIRFAESTGLMSATDSGRTASHFYIKYDTIEVFNEYFTEAMTEDRIFFMVSRAQEFDQIKVRDEEMEELDRHMHNCHLPVAGGSENAYGKVNILLQTYVSRSSVDNFSLISDQAYVAQNSTRIIRGLFEMALRKNWPLMAGRLLKLSKIIEKRLWDWEHPLRQFGFLSPEVLTKIEERGLSIDRLKEMDPKEIGHMIHHVNMGPRIKDCVCQIPTLDIEPSVQPITRTVLRVVLKITATFHWNDRTHGKTGEPFWIWIEDPDNNHMYHSEYFMMHKKHVQLQQCQTLVFTVPIFEPLPSQYYVRVISDRWLGSEMTFPISFQHLILPEKHPPHTELLDLQPLPVSALCDKKFESLYSFTHFNPIQTQIFHPLYHSDCNVLLGAPTGSGKTIAAELAIFRIFRVYPNTKAVYIAPLKALVRERMEDWKVRIEQRLGKRVVELTGDVAPDMQAVARADLIVTTPEKWDGISRSWQTRSYVKAVTLLVIDEIHLLGNDRGPVLEVIVSRTNFISSHTERRVRVVGLSTALANARDLADWLGIKQMGLFNFRPSVRPVPLEVHINGFPGKHYCPRMATMNRPAYHAIKLHSPAKPVLIFVSSRRQTRLTALDLIAYLAADDNPKQWLHLPEAEMDTVISGIRENNLKLTLAFGIGIHHAGLHEHDRKIVEGLFVNQKIQVLIATSTLAWGVNFPAHLVIVKGTEYYDGKTKHYIDFPITDVLQMMGRAGRPQFDDQGVAVILVHDVKKHFYKKFLYEPFPVESSLLEVLADHLNAEIVAGTISTKQDAMDYITWTYFFRRLVMNPSFYKLDDTSTDHINKYLSQLVQRAVQELVTSYCVDISEDDYNISPTTLGRIASYYYLNHLTVRMFRDKLSASSSIADLLLILANAHEFAELPVRHNEDQVNSELATKLPIRVDPHSYDNSNTKTHLLLQAHFSRVPLPSADYHTDTKSVMDQVPRVLQALLDVSADAGWLATTLQVIQLMQMVLQGRWNSDNTLLMLPHLQPYHLNMLRRQPTEAENTRHSTVIDCLPELVDYVGGRYECLVSMLGTELQRAQYEQIVQVLNQLPVIDVTLHVKGQLRDETGRQCEQIPVSIGFQRGAHRDWVKVQADTEYVLSVVLTKINKRRDNRAYTPHFAKPKDEGWIIVLGEVESRDVVALKRVGCLRGQRTTATLAFFAPERPRRVIYTLYIMSDCYLGLDQQYDICLEVTEPMPVTNTDISNEIDINGEVDEV